MSEKNPNLAEIKKTVRLLDNLKEIAGEASLTGSLSGGARTAVQQYNAIVRRMEQIGEVPAQYFPALAEDAKFDEVGVVASQLAAYIEIEEEPEAQPLHHQEGPKINFEINGPVTALGDLDKLKELGEVIRQHLPGWMKTQQPTETPPPAGASDTVENAAPSAPAPPQPPQPTPRAAINAAPAHPAQFIPDPHTQEQRV